MNEKKAFLKKSSKDLERIMSQRKQMKKFELFVEIELIFFTIILISSGFVTHFVLRFQILPSFVQTRFQHDIVAICAVKILSTI